MFPFASAFVRPLFVVVLAWLAASQVVFAEPPRKELPLAGEVFEVAGRPAFLIEGKVPADTKNKRWVWYAPTLPRLPGNEEKWMFERFRDAGIAIGGIDAGESYGSPKGNQLFSQFHAALVARGYSNKPVMLGRSRGGLMTLSWAAANPDKVSAFAGIYPVCNVASYPGLAGAAGAFEMSADDLKRRLSEFNPVDRLEPLAKAGVPLFAIHGDVDKVVPLDANSGLVKERYEKLGGKMSLLIPAGQGHNMWPGFFQCQELVDFVRAHAQPSLTLTSPLDYQVVQRHSKTAGKVTISGLLPTTDVKLEVRTVTDRVASDWRSMTVNVDEVQFGGEVELPAGGWYRLEIRARKNEFVVAEAAVEHVGIGEVFVVAGQSNSANHGEQKLRPSSGRVTAFDGQRWRIADDPQPGASGKGGSFLPPLGDALVAKLNVPVGFVACGVGATSVREWLPKGSTFPNPPTLTGNVERLASGDWSAKGNLFAMLVARSKPLGKHGFRAVLWHQGESDANQKDATRTLAGDVYRASLEKLMNESRRELGWNVPWFVAQATYHIPGDESSPDIRAAQTAVVDNRLTFAGPDTDTLKGSLRDANGQGVHFSAAGQQAHAMAWADKILPWIEKRLDGRDK